MKYILFFVAILNSFTGKSQDGKIIEQTKIPTSPDSLLKPSSPFYTTLQQILDSVNVFQITYLSDGLRVKGYMDIPKKPGKYPCIIFNRGGNRENSKLTKDGYMGMLAELASYGYCVVASQYRGNDGGEGAEEFGGKDIDDVLNMIPLLSNLDNADTSRIGMFGGSRGGMMTYLALTKTNRIKAAVVLSGIADFKQSIENTNFNADSMFYSWLSEYRENKKQFIKDRSPMEFADKICKTTPIFIIQGTGDGRVTTPQVFDLARKFYALKQPFRLTIFEGATHTGGPYVEKMHQIKNFLDYYVRDKSKLPNLELR